MSVHSLGIFVIVVSVALLVWPFLQYIGTTLYLRYFDSSSLVNPRWEFARLLTVWDEQEHLGYTHAREIAYLSLQELLSFAMAPFGVEFRNRSALAFTQVLIFGSMLWYLRSECAKRPLPLLALAAFFYAANPFVLSFVHDGYSGLLVDYALLPFLLQLVRYAKATGRPALLTAVPLVLFLFGMYTITSAMVTLFAIVALEFVYLKRAVLASAATRLGIACAFLANVTWALPLAVLLISSPSPPILRETASDVAVISAYGSISNVFLLRNYPEIWTTSYARECTVCRFYETPYFTIAMMLVAGLALYALWRTRRQLFWIAIAAAVVSTGYRYQDEIVGLPYAIVMSLPTFDIFRGSLKFTAILAFAYAIGIVEAPYVVRASRGWAFAIAASICFATYPYWSGKFIEFGGTSKPHFPNFVVKFPEPYGNPRSMADLRSKIPENSTTLLLPNAPLAAYTWGVYGNDFLEAALGRPTLSTWYLPQPNVALNNILAAITADDVRAARAIPLMRALGLGSVLVHDDVLNAPKQEPARLGPVVYRKGHVALVRLADAPLERYFSDAKLTAMESPPESLDVNVAFLAGLTGTVVRDSSVNDGEAFCRSDVDLAFGNLRLANGRTAFAVSLPCVTPIRVTVIASRDANVPNISIGKVRIPLRFVRMLPGGYTEYAGLGRIERTSNIIGIETHAAVDDIAFVRLARQSFERTPTIERAASSLAGDTFAKKSYGRYVVFNKSYDPAWIGIAHGPGGYAIVGHVAIDAFANAWFLQAGQTLTIVNVVSLSAMLGAFIGIAMVGIAGLVIVRTARSRGPAHE